MIIKLVLSILIMTRKGNKKGKKGMKMIPDAVKTLGPISRSKNSKEFNGDEDASKMNLDDYLDFILGPGANGVEWQSDMNLRDELEAAAVDNFFCDRSMESVAEKIKEELNDLLECGVAMDGAGRLVWMCNISYVFDKYIGPFSQKVKEVFDKETYDGMEETIRELLEEAEDAAIEESQLYPGVESVSKTESPALMGKPEHGEGVGGHPSPDTTLTCINKNHIKSVSTIG